jgi:hypothetical protein
MNLNILVGFSGFVGSNLVDAYRFGAVFNSKNIKSAFGLSPSLCVYAGIRAEKYLAAQQPQSDSALIEVAIENIKKIAPQRLVLISTIDVYPTPFNVDENSSIDSTNAHPYGVHRWQLEQWVQENVARYCIIRLPALFGKNIKKNFIYDLLYGIPFMLNEEKWSKFSAQEASIAALYTKQENGFYQCMADTDEKKEELKAAFSHIGFSALQFTDSRAIFQFYNLIHLWDHIEISLKNGLGVVNLATEPLTAAEVYAFVRGKDFVNKLSAPIPNYNFRTIHAGLFGGKDGYIYDKKTVLKEIKAFIGEYA